MQQLSEGTLLQGGKYKIEKMLGQGGFGITYLATQVLLGRKVCIKEFFFKQFCERDETTSHVTLGTKSNREFVDKYMNKFIKEARTISQLDHPHIIRIHDIFEENSTAYYVMEFHSGGSLGDLVKDGKPLPETEAVKYITQIADAVGYIHKRNINHLDIKPGNILIDARGCGVLIDFGLSKQYDEQGSQTSSTPVGISHGYAPMEQYNQNGVSTFSPQSDIYSLGATLYKLVTGATPPQANEIFNDGLPALPAHLSDGVRKAIEHAMQPRKKERPATAEEFVALLSCGSASAASSTDEATKIIAEPEETLVLTPKVEPIEKPTPEPVKPVVPEKKEPERKKEEPYKENTSQKKSSLLKWVMAAAFLFGAVVLVVHYYTRSEFIPNSNEDTFGTPICVGLDGKYGFIDNKGNEIIPLKYDYALEFSEGLAAVQFKDKWCYIDKSGNEVVSLKSYDKVKRFYDGLAIVELNNKQGFIDKSGNEVIPLKYKFVNTFSDGLARVILNDKYGFIDKNGNEVIPLKYDLAGDFKDGLALVYLNDKYGFIDKNGNEIIPLKYDFAGDFKEGLARVSLNDKQGFIDKSGNEVIPLKYDVVDGFSEGLARFRFNDRWGFVDKNGNEVISLECGFPHNFSEGLACVELNDKQGFIDKSGNEVIPFKYDNFFGFFKAGNFNEGLARVSLNDKEGFIDKSGNEVIPLKYDNVSEFFNGIALVVLNGKSGFIDISGKEVIPLKYRTVRYSPKGTDYVEFNGEVITTYYSDISQYPM